MLKVANSFSSLVGYMLRERERGINSYTRTQEAVDIKKNIQGLDINGVAAANHQYPKTPTPNSQKQNKEPKNHILPIILLYKASLNNGRSHLIQDTESISSLADLYSSSRFAHCCLLSIKAGSSSNNRPSCAPSFLPICV